MGSLPSKSVIKASRATILSRRLQHLKWRYEERKSRIRRLGGRD